MTPLSQHCSCRAFSFSEMTMNSPSDDTSFHTAGSLESSITEMDFSDDGEDQVRQSHPVK